MQHEGKYNRKTTQKKKIRIFILSKVTKKLPPREFVSFLLRHFGKVRIWDQKERLGERILCISQNSLSVQLFLVL